MFLAAVCLMIQLIRKISAFTLTCLLAVNIATGATVVVGHCQPSLDSNNPMDIDHCDGLLNFAFPMQGCCGECNDIFCDLMKNPSQVANVANTSPSQGSFYLFFPATATPIPESDVWIALFKPRYLFSTALARSQIPLYIEHLSLII